MRMISVSKPADVGRADFRRLGNSANFDSATASFIQLQRR
jgi:hypothetical protein